MIDPPLLKGLRVIDFTRVLSGPLCTALLADLGAEIIKVEPPQGDDYRSIGPFRDGHSALFSVMNRNKKSVVLDLRVPSAQIIARSLCVGADVVVENFRPGVADKLGIGYASISAENPNIIYTSISGFGQTGPAAHRPAYDIILQAMTGLMEVTGEPDGAPTVVGETISDVVSGLFASWATLAALWSRERTGKGTHVDVAMLDATLSTMMMSVSRYLFTGAAPARVGNRHALSAPFGLFRARDGYFALAVLNSKHFRLLCDTMGAPAIADDPRFLSDAARVQNEPALRAHIEAWSVQRTAQDVVEQLERAQVPAAKLQNIAQALADPQTMHRAFIQPVEDDALPGLSLPSQPVHFSGHSRTPPTRAPRLGEHTDAVMTTLGLAQSRIAELHALGVFGGHKE